MANPKSKSTTTEIDVLALKTGRFVCHILGVSPLICNSMSAKSRQSLLSPSKKTTAEKASSAKHDPLAEYRGSLYTSDHGPTRVVFPSVAFKRALASVATDLGGAKKAQVDRLVWAIGDKIPVWGVPQLRMDVVRSADMTRTPDIRTRAILVEWACRLELAYVEPTITAKTVANLLASAGLVRGIGDFRQEKGAGNYGQFQLVDRDDPAWARIVAAGARPAQEAAIAEPGFYDDEAERLYAWWKSEEERRGRGPKAANGAREEVVS